jgi:uncharacterized membrane protein
MARPSLFRSWDLLALLGLAGLAAFHAQVIGRLPEPVPTHFNALGQANGWTPKALLPLILCIPPAALWLLCFIAGLAASLRESDPVRARLAALGPVRGLVPLGMCAVMASALAIPLAGLRALHGGVAVFFGCLFLGIVLSAVERRSLARASDAPLYRWGAFYLNPRDPRLWVPKRLGVGMTLNYAKPAAWWITGLLVLLPVGLAVALLFFARP